MRNSIFGKQEIPKPKQTIIKTQAQVEENQTSIWIYFARVMIFLIPISLICFLMYKCSEGVNRDREIKYKKIAEERNISIEEVKNMKKLLSVYKIISNHVGELEVSAKYYHSDRLPNGRLHIKFYDDSCGCDAFAEYTDVISIMKIKDGFP
jgi:hypothetical protein